MTLIEPTSAPSVHLHVLPSSAVGAEVSVSDKIANHLALSVWCESPRTYMLCNTAESDDAFVDSHCYDCEYHCEQYNIGRPDVDTDWGYQEAAEDVYIWSPCPCYNDGIGEVEFPCAAGHHRESTEESNLDVSQMKFEVLLHETTFKIHYNKQYAYLQAIAWTDEGPSISLNETECINTFGDHAICWGRTAPPSLMLDDVVATFMASPANEDLCTADTHSDNACELENCDVGNEYHYEVQSSNTIVQFVPQNHRSKAVVIAYVRTMPSSFVLLASSGVPTEAGIAALPVYLYPKVQLDEETVLDVWVSDELAIGKRLMFLAYEKLEPAVYLGQIDNTFNLEPCKLTTQQSSDVAEPVSN